MAQKKKTGRGSQILIVGIAAIFDLISLIPITGDFLGPIFWIGVSIFLFMRGYGFVNARRLVTSGISLVVELIPAAQAFPALILGSVMLISILKAEDKGLPVSAATGAKNVGGVRAAEAVHRLNRGGVRLPSKDAMVE